MTILAFLLGLSLLGNFINIIMWRDDIACRDWYEDDLFWEREKLDAAIHELDETDALYAFALEQLYAKATLQEAMDGGTLIVVSDHDLQALAADKGPEASFSFDRLVTSALDDDEDDGLVPND